jgi:hypothetical protein
LRFQLPPCISPHNLILWPLSTSATSYLPHLRFIGLGLLRLCFLTLTPLAPALPSLSGRHFTLAIAITSFLTESEPVIP